MNIRRFLSYVVVAVLATVLWITWQKEHPEPTAPTIAAPQAGNELSPEAFAPSIAPASRAANSPVGPQQTPKAQQLTSGPIVTVTTDTLILKISLNGGNIISSELVKYAKSLTDKAPIQILSDELSELYVAQSGLAATRASGKATTITYQSLQTNYTLLPADQLLVVTLQGKTADGLHVTKTLTFVRGSYAVKINDEVKNTTAQAWQGQLYTQLVRRQPEEEHHFFQARSYDGASVSSPDTPYHKLSYEDMDKVSYHQVNADGWVAMQQHYFLSAWIPGNAAEPHHFYSQVTPSTTGKNIYTVGFFSNPQTIAAGQQGNFSATFYVGPEIAEYLNPLAPGLDRTIDYGWLWWISAAIFWIMSIINYVVHNWGWTIVMTTILIKFVVYPLSAASFRSMARMRELQPKMQQLKERYADDRPAMSRATMELYRDEKINPLGGCLPMLIQIPIFIALYYVIIESVQLRQAPFIFWIYDLSGKDPYYVLPILMGISMLIQQRLTPASPDPTQAKIMMFLPVVFTVFFVNFPAGLTLYWLVNNCVQILQQWYVGKTFESHKAKKAKKSKAKKKNRSLS